MANLDFPVNVKLIAGSYVVSVDTREIAEARGACLTVSAVNLHRAIGMFVHAFEEAKLNKWIDPQTRFHILDSRAVFNNLAPITQDTI